MTANSFGRAIFLVFVALLFGSNAAELPSFDWAVKFSEANFDNGDVSLLATASGEMFLVQNIYNGGFVAATQISKLRPDGSKQWTNQILGTQAEFTQSGLGPDGSCYFLGYAGTNAFLSSSVKPEGRGRTFIQKIDGPGETRWIRQFGPENSLYPSIVAIDTNENYYVAGNYVGEASIGDQVLPPTGDPQVYHVFLAKFDQAGKVAWARTGGGSSGYAGIRDLAIDSAGNALICGFGDGVLLPGDYPLDSRLGFVAKYQPNGDLVWVRPGTTNQDGNVAVDAISVDSHGNIFIASYDYVDNSINLSKMDGNGEFLWTRKGIGKKNYYLNVGKLMVDSTDRCFFNGSYSGSLTFGTSKVSTIGNFDMFIAKFDSEGALRWLTTTTATVGVQNGAISVCDVQGARIALTPAGGCYVSASLMGPVKFGPTLLRARTTGPFEVAVASIKDPDVIVANNGPGPALQVRRNGDILILSWPSSAGVYNLESVADLTQSQQWSPLAINPSVVGLDNTVTNLPADKSRFFRLKKL